MIPRKLLSIEKRKKGKLNELCFFDQVGKISFFYEQEDTISIFEKLVSASIDIAFASNAVKTPKNRFGIAFLRAANIFIDSDFREEIEDLTERVLQEEAKQKELFKTISVIKKLRGNKNE